MPDREILRSLPQDTLIDMLEDAAKNWLAHDGLWFLAVEKQYGMEKAIELDKEAWMHPWGLLAWNQAVRQAAQ